VGTVRPLLAGMMSRRTRRVACSTNANSRSSSAARGIVLGLDVGACAFMIEFLSVLCLLKNIRLLSMRRAVGAGIETHSEQVAIGP